MTEHDRIRGDRAARCDRNNLDSLADAIRGLQSTDDPSLVPLHDDLMKQYQELKKRIAHRDYVMGLAVDTVSGLLYCSQEHGDDSSKCLKCVVLGRIFDAMNKAISDEREACAKLAQAKGEKIEHGHTVCIVESGPMPFGTAYEIAADIRKRGS